MSPSGKTLTPTWSSAKYPDGRPQRYNCCPRPDTIPRDGECLPNCRVVAPGSRQCGRNCCQPGQLCKNGACVPCPRDSCTSPGGATICCEAGTMCCFNNRSAVCCGPQQTCRAQRRRTATWTCDSGRKCDPECCTRSETCCGGKECCSTDRCTTVASPACCPQGRAMCKSGTANVCCGDSEYCLWKADGELTPLIGTCKRGCAPGNRAGTQCCGTGYQPNRARTACVRVL